MLTIFGYSIFLILLYFVVLLFILINTFFNYRGKNVKEPMSDNLPKVSVLVAARNEEANIERCLLALEKLSYPKHLLEIIIGNDESTDNTVKIVDRFIKGRSHFSFYDIRIKLGKAKGKANVLAHLAQIATSEYLFVTDADIEVPENWIQYMLPHFEKNIAIVSGTTYVEGHDRFSKIQSLDWMFFGGVLNSFANAGIACTGVGNNMCFRRSAYIAIGGYENMEFSITEDYKLFAEFRKAGYGWKNILNKETLNLSQPIDNFRNLMKQRRRWITGAMELPWIWKIVFIVFGFFPPSLLAVLIFAPQIGLMLWFSRLFLEGIYLSTIGARLHRTENLGSYLWYQLFSFIIPFAYMYHFLKREPNEWKGRMYS
jgi:cellulose synthase/poly-beta-1,6-N-acetylglucosamine synthase-like glycosyltransferase